MARNLLGVKRKDLKMCKKNFSLKHLIKYLSVSAGTGTMNLNV